MQTMIDLAMPSIHTSGGLACMIGSTLACRFEVAEFFVSWQGVLTLAFTGFPDALLEVRSWSFENESQCPSGFGRYVLSKSISFRIRKFL